MTREVHKFFMSIANRLFKLEVFHYQYMEVLFKSILKTFKV